MTVETQRAQEDDYHVSLVGRFEVRRGDTSLHVPSSSERLIAFLALADGPVERSRVAGTLWCDKCDDRAMANLRSALWRVRKSGVDVICESGSRIGLVESATVDKRVLDAWGQRLREPSPADRDLTIATSRFGDELLPEWYDDWIVMERERFRQRLLHHLDLLVDHLRHRARFAAAIDAAYGAIALEPLREISHRALVRIHLAEGNVGEAIRHIKMCREMFLEELGIDVSAMLGGLVSDSYAVA